MAEAHRHLRTPAGAHLHVVFEDGLDEVTLSFAKGHEDHTPPDGWYWDADALRDAVLFLRVLANDDPPQERHLETTNGAHMHATVDGVCFVLSFAMEARDHPEGSYWYWGLPDFREASIFLSNLADDLDREASIFRSNLANDLDECPDDIDEPEGS